MSSATRVEKESDHSLCDHQEESPTISFNAIAIISTDKTGLRLKLKLSKLEYHNEEAAYDHDKKQLQSISNSGEAASVVVSEEANSATSVESTTCMECGKTFPSMKALYGHLRSHPNRGYRGLHPPPKKSSSKRKSTSCSSNQSHPKTKIPRTDPQSRYAAETLLIMSRDKRWGLFDLAEGLEEGELLPETTNIKVDKSYQCSICNKSFGTHQALGGHKASHNKQRLNSEGERGKGSEENGTVHDSPNGAVAKAAVVKQHRCEVCGEAFPTGQSLGGHKRKHFTGLSSSVTSSEKRASVTSSEEVEESARRASVTLLEEAEENAGREYRGFDLNEVPQLEGGPTT